MPSTTTMRTRIGQRFEQLRAKGELGIVAYVTAGDPALAATGKIVLSLAEAGADVVELGVPFSDPLADGIVNQLAAQRGLESGTTPPLVLQTVAEIRRDSQIPIVLYIYYNLLHHYGLEKFVKDAAQAGVDGLLVLDLPPEESANYESIMAKAKLCVIYLVAPTTPDDRIGFIVKRGTGFIYYVSREGVTGMQQKVSENIAQMTAKIRSHTKLPVAVGFGISTPEQAKVVAACSDAVVVGSAIVNQIAKHGKSRDLVAHVCAFTKLLIAAVKGA